MPYQQISSERGGREDIKDSLVFEMLMTVRELKVFLL